MSEHTHAHNTTSTHTHKVRNAVLKNKQNQQHGTLACKEYMLTV